MDMGISHEAINSRPQYTHVYEWCPHCEIEVKLDAILKKQICPNCGEMILPCALCDCDVVKCTECTMGK